VGGVEAWAARSDERVGVLVWNGTLDQSQANGSPLLNRSVTVTVADLPAGEYTVRHHRIDESHTNIRAVWHDIGGDADWPDAGQWNRLHAADTLAEFSPPQRVRTSGEPVTFRFGLPMPGVSYLEFTRT
jgi:xylan 1,4-beta-xylosidase